MKTYINTKLIKYSLQSPSLFYGIPPPPPGIYKMNNKNLCQSKRMILQHIFCIYLTDVPTVLIAQAVVIHSQLEQQQQPFSQTRVEMTAKQRKRRKYIIQLAASVAGLPEILALKTRVLVSLYFFFLVSGKYTSLVLQCFQVVYHGMSLKSLALSLYTLEPRENCITILHHAMENTMANTINLRYIQHVIGKLDVALSNIQQISCFLCQHGVEHIVLFQSLL